MATFSTATPRTLAEQPVPFGTFGPSAWTSSASPAYVVGALVSYVGGTPSVAANYCLVSVAPPYSATAPPYSGTTVASGWRQLADGEPAWNYLQPYKPGDIVSYAASNKEGLMYLCLTSAVGSAQAPSGTLASSPYWKALAVGAGVGVITSLSGGAGSATTSATPALSVGVIGYTTGTAAPTLVFTGSSSALSLGGNIPAPTQLVSPGGNVVVTSGATTTAVEISSTAAAANNNIVLTNAGSSVGADIALAAKSDVQITYGDSSLVENSLIVQSRGVGGFLAVSAAAAPNPAYTSALQLGPTYLQWKLKDVAVVLPSGLATPTAAVSSFTITGVSTELRETSVVVSAVQVADGVTPEIWLVSATPSTAAGGTITFTLSGGTPSASTTMRIAWHVVKL